ncbi:MAG: T9SS type A sorting domain-containing protein [Candidatus Marinimicrobia bacterium]|nr:T9SS type A sorting domain-containing protein [Candidatus Neomarinimicrobiota bacterium]
MKKIITYVAIVALLFAVVLVAAPLDGQPLQKTAATTAGQVTRSMSNISNWGYWVYSNGKSAQTPNGSSGGIYPRGTAGAIYQDGFIWGGKVDTTGNDIGDDIRVGGQTYNIGTIPGWVITGGDYADAVTADPSNPLVRIYRIRLDYLSLTHAMLIQDAAELNEVSPSSVTEAMTQELMDQYALDWEEWPVEHGAPYYDLDNDGVYTAGTDEPGIAQADQVLWYVVNDYSQSATTGLYGSLPIGIELQTTLWAYNQPGVRLGQIIFKSNKIINKSGKTITDMYVSQWADPDLGTYSNDFCGCDTTLSMGYAYNGEATDADYDAFDLAPPAFGYDFFQGPMVASPGDTAIFELEYVTGYKNLPMTSFGWFSAGAAIEDPTLGEYEGTLQFYNLIRGYLPLDDVVNPTPWYLGNDTTKATTMFPLSGDPVAGTGDLDGTENYFPPGDRRICLSSGPFTFEPGDIQEVVVAVLGGLGVNNIGSVADLKLTDAVAQTLFDGLFLEVPKPPASPDVTARAFENTVVLEWGSDPVKVAAVEENPVSGYEFEGYTVYQLPHATATKDQAVRLVTYDIDNGIKLIYENRTPGLYEGEEVSVPICYGDDTGIQRYYVIDWDYVDGKPLYEGKTYYYAVTAYNQNHDDGRLAEKAMESAMIALPVTLQEPLPGSMLNTVVASDITAEHTAGFSGGQVSIKVVDPFAVTGEDYSITFSYNTDSTAILFNVLDENDVVLSSNNSQVVNLTDKGGAPIVDGLEIKVAGPPTGIAECVQPDAHGSSTIVDYNVWHSLQAAGDGSQPWHRAAGAAAMIMDSRSGDLNGGLYANVPDRFQNWGTSDFEIVFGDSSVAWSYLNDYVLTEKVPFALYKYNLDGTVKRQFIAVFDDQVTGTEYTWDQGIASAYTATSGYEEIYSYDNLGTGYQVADEAAYIAADDIYAAPSSTGWGSAGNPYGYPQINRLIVAMYPEGTTGPPVAGTVIRFNTYKPIDLDDVFTFTTAGLDPTSSDSLMALALDKINVFPNPYYAYNELATSPYDQYVTFTHLPAKATIKIFNLAGILVNTIEHDNAASQFEKWDLTNASDIPVGSGMYLAHIDMPDEGAQKILKVMVVQNKQILEYY